MVIKEELVAVKLGLDEEKYVPHKKEIGLGNQGPRTLSIVTNACRRKPNVKPKIVNFESGPGTPKRWVYSDTAVQTRKALRNIKRLFTRIRTPPSAGPVHL